MIDSQFENHHKLNREMEYLYFDIDKRVNFLEIALNLQRILKEDFQRLGEQVQK